MLFTDIVGSTALATSGGTQSSTPTTRKSASSSGTFVGERSTPLATVLWPPLTARLGPFAVPRRSPKPPKRWACDSGGPAHRRVRGSRRRSWRTGRPHRRPRSCVGRSRRCPRLGDCEGSGCGVGDRVHRSWRARTQRCAWVLEALRCSRLNYVVIGPNGGLPQFAGRGSTCR